MGDSEGDAPELPIEATTVVVVISHRGENRTVHGFVKRCKELGATVIAVTSGVASALAQMADIVLLTGAPVEDNRKKLEVAPSRVVQMAVLQALVHAVATHQDQERG